MVQVLDANVPGHTVESRAIGLHLRDVFPWSWPSEPHQDICDSDSWWQRLQPSLSHAFFCVGMERDRARELASLVRYAFADAAKWRLFDDTVPSLNELRKLGWRHVILSNHVPELEAIVSALGLRPLVEQVMCSAWIGYEKPHPRAFYHALRTLGSVPEVWMVGDDPIADVAGAKAVGIRAIQVRSPRHEEADHYATALLDVQDVLHSVRDETGSYQELSG